MREIVTLSGAWDLGQVERRQIRRPDNSLEVALRRLLPAKAEYDRLKRERAAFQCLLEDGGRRPCWHKSNNNVDRDRDATDDWCEPCQRRELMRTKYQSAVYIFGNAKTAFWNALRGHARRDGWDGAPRITPTGSSKINPRR